VSGTLRNDILLNVVHSSASFSQRARSTGLGAFSALRMHSSARFRYSLMSSIHTSPYASTTNSTAATITTTVATTTTPPPPRQTTNPKSPTTHRRLPKKRKEPAGAYESKSNGFQQALTAFSPGVGRPDRVYSARPAAAVRALASDRFAGRASDCRLAADQAYSGRPDSVVGSDRDWDCSFEASWFEMDSVNLIICSAVTT
jgi:hypothetical protein